MGEKTTATHFGSWTKMDTLTADLADWIKPQLQPTMRKVAS